MLKEIIDNSDSEKGIQVINDNAKQIINPSYIYNLWIISFLKEFYKRTRN